MAAPIHHKLIILGSGPAGLFAALTLARYGAPPIVLETPYGNVRAGSEASASEVASLLVDLAPRVREILRDRFGIRAPVSFVESLRVVGLLVHRRAEDPPESLDAGVERHARALDFFDHLDGGRSRGGATRRRGA